MTLIDESAFESHLRCVEGLKNLLPVIEQAARLVLDALRAGRRIYLFGNGGSAADAQHVAAELVGRFRRSRAPLPAVALTTDTSLLTAVANDLDYEQVFARQVEALVLPGDVVWAISTSGSSPNVLAGIEAAAARDACVIGFTGKSGGQMRGRCDVCLCVPAEATERVQEGHQLAYHLICEAIERAFTQP